MTVADKDLSVALVGIGGYGNSYVSSLLEAPASRRVRLVAVADPRPASCLYLPELHRRQIPIYPTLRALQKQHSPELTIICTPLHFHSDHTIEALSAGSHVLCEKPLSSTPAQAAEMALASHEARRQVSIGYQWSFSAAIQALKTDIAAGLFGKPRRMRTIVLWPRDEGYYSRNDWAGRRYSNADQPVFDNPLNNACAHHIHNMMYVLGERPDRSAMASSARAELYRANEIETFDTAAVRVWTTAGVEVLCIVSHATRNDYGPSFVFEFENAIVEFCGSQPTAASRDGAGLFARFADGRVKEYGSPDREPDRKLWAAVESARSNKPTICGIQASLPHTLLTDALNRCAAEPVEFPASLSHSERQSSGYRRRWIEGLDEALLHCFKAGKLPFETGAPWAIEGNDVHLTTQTVFASDISPKLLERVQIQPFAAPLREPA